ncbi:Bug family tripartite tricarboxylate transporter substrate binding protein [Cupriavidus sp. 8B]
MNNSRRMLLKAIAAGVAAPMASSVHAQGTVRRLIAGFTPGSVSDTVARVLSERLKLTSGDTYLVENRLGAGGLIAAQSVIRAEPDGKSILVHSSAFTVAPLLRPKMIDTANLTPLIALASAPTVLVTYPGRRIKTFQGLIEYARANPGKLFAASAGIGTSSHMNLERLKYAARIDITHVPMKGSPDALNEVIAGRADVYFAALAQALPYIKDGRLIPLAIGSPNRTPLLPDLPTTVEAGYPGSEYLAWFGALISTATPAPLMSRLYTDFKTVLDEPDTKRRLVDLACDPMSMSQAEFSELIRKEFVSNAKLIKEANIKI